MTNIDELQPRTGNVDLIAEVIEVSEPREFTKFGRTGKVANAKIKDETGEVRLTLWNEQIDEVNTGDKIKITSGWANEWQGTIQVSTGRQGKIEVLEKGNGETEEGLTQEETDMAVNVDEEEDLTNYKI